MKTCNDCIHCEACISQVPRTFWDSETFYDGCKYFKEKSRFIELPCKVGIYSVAKVQLKDTLRILKHLTLHGLLKTGNFSEKKYSSLAKKRKSVKGA